MKVDLHIHTTYSDGELPPCDIFMMAKEKQISLISITDHDYIANYQKFALEFGVKYVNGMDPKVLVKKVIK